MTRRRAFGLVILMMAVLVAAIIWWISRGTEETTASSASTPRPAATEVRPFRKVFPPPATEEEEEEEDDEEEPRIVAIEVDRQATCAGGNIRYAIEVGGDDSRVVPRVGFGARRGPGSVGVARQFKSHQDAGQDELTVELVDAFTGEVRETKTVPIEFLDCGDEEVEHKLRLNCDLHTTEPMAMCRLVDPIADPNVEWELRPAYVDDEGPSVFATGSDVEMELPIHKGGGAMETYLVDARAAGPGGEPLTGRTSVVRPRRGYKERVRDQELLLWSRQVGPNTHAITNTSPEDIELEPTMSLEHRPCEGGEARVTEIDTASVLGSTTVVANDRMMVEWSPPPEPGVCGYRIFFKGAGVESGYSLTGALRAR